MEPGSFCAMPFLNLQLQPTGKVAPCCWNQDYVVGDVRESSLSEIWNSPGMQALRREFLSGQVRTCAQQIRHIGCNRIFREFEPRIERAEVQSGPLRKIDVRLNGRCNLECVMCEVWKEPNGVYDAAGFWQEGPERIFPHLVEIEVLGGEPFVQRDTFKLIREISRVNAGCSWYFATNANWSLTPYVTEHLDLVPIRIIHVSLDSARRETYEAIRRKGSFDRAVRTLRDLTAYRERRARQGRPFRIWVTFCIQRSNWREIPEMLAFARGLGAEPWLQFLYDPAPLSLATLPSDERERAIRQLAEWSEPAGDRELLARILTPLLELRDGLKREASPAPAPS